MTNINGQRTITIKATAGAQCEIDYKGRYSACIINNTSDVLTIAETSDYADNGTISYCVKLPAGAFINRFKSDLSDKLYLYPEADGDISVIRLN